MLVETPPVKQLFGLPGFFAFLAVLMALTLQATLPSISFSENPSAKTDLQKPLLWVVKIHADWCGRCQHIEPAFQEIQKQYDPSRVEFIVLDVTDRKRTRQAEEKAGILGIAPWFQEHKSATSTVALISPSNRKVIRVFLNEPRQEPYKQSIDQFLKKAESGSK